MYCSPPLKSAGLFPTCNCGKCLQITIRLAFSILLAEPSNQSSLQLHNFVLCLLFVVPFIRWAVPTDMTNETAAKIVTLRLLNNQRSTVANDTNAMKTKAIFAFERHYGGRNMLSVNNLSSV